MNKDLNNIYNKEKTNSINKNKFRITKQNLNDINDYILNFQRYFELIKNYRFEHSQYLNNYSQALKDEFFARA